MKFYSYDYVLSQISQQNWVTIVISGLLILLTGFFAVKAYRDKHDSKFRELSIISILTLVAVVLIGISNFQNSQSNNDQFQRSLHFIEVISKELDVKKEDVYVNTSAATDGAILKVGEVYYRAIAGSDPDSYLLEKMDLYKTDVELVGLISLVFVINVTGKGNLAPNSAVDQIQNFVLGGIIGGVIYNSSITILQYIVILLMWTILILLLKWLNTNVRFMKHLIDGKPTVIIKNGKLDPEACRSKGLSASDVALKLRGQGIFQLKDVKRAVIEQNGQLIVVRAGDENPKYPIITDGVVQLEILETIGKSEEWLLAELEKEGYDNVLDIFIAEYDKGKINVVTY